MSRPLPVTVFSDYVCPYCYIGDGILERLQSEEDIELEITWQPLELHRGTPADGVSLSELFQLSPEAARQQSEGLRGAMAEFGLELNAPEMMFNTRKAHLLGEYAQDQGKYLPVREALFQAYWVKGRNLAQDIVLANIAQKAGLDPEDALASLDNDVYEQRLKDAVTAARKHGVQGLPAFVFADKYVLYGAQPYFFLAEAVRAYRDRWQAEN